MKLITIPNRATAPNRRALLRIRKKASRADGSIRQREPREALPWHLLGGGAEVGSTNGCLDVGISEHTLSTHAS